LQNLHVANALMFLNFCTKVSRWWFWRAETCSWLSCGLNCCVCLLAWFVFQL